MTERGSTFTSFPPQFSRFGIRQPPFFRPSLAFRLPAPPARWWSQGTPRTFDGWPLLHSDEECRSGITLMRMGEPNVPGARVVKICQKRCWALTAGSNDRQRYGETQRTAAPWSRSTTLPAKSGLTAPPPLLEGVLAAVRYCGKAGWKKPLCGKRCKAGRDRPFDHRWTTSPGCSTSAAMMWRTPPSSSPMRSSPDDVKLFIQPDAVSAELGKNSKRQRARACL